MAEEASFQTLNYWILQTIAMGLTIFLIPKLRVSSIFGPVFAVVGLALVNAVIWDAALFFSIPDHFSSQVALLLLTNGIIFWVLVKLLPGIEVQGFLPALVAPLVFTVCSVLVSQYGKDIDWQKVWVAFLAFMERLKASVKDSSNEQAWLSMIFNV